MANSKACIRYTPNHVVKDFSELPYYMFFREHLFNVYLRQYAHYPLYVGVSRKDQFLVLVRGEEIASAIYDKVSYWTLSQMAEAILQLHHHGICHGDIRADNFIRYRGKVYLIDFEFSYFTRRERVIHMPVYPSDYRTEASIQPKSKRGIISPYTDLLAFRGICKELLGENFPNTDLPRWLHDLYNENWNGFYQAFPSYTPWSPPLKLEFRDALLYEECMNRRITEFGKRLVRYLLLPEAHTAREIWSTLRGVNYDLGWLISDINPPDTLLDNNPKDIDNLLRVLPLHLFLPFGDDLI